MNPPASKEKAISSVGNKNVQFDRQNDIHSQSDPGQARRA
jgi:hypothetical protein